MLILAIDTTSQYSSIALAESGSVKAEYNWCCRQNHTVELIPAIENLLDKNGCSITDVKGIGVALGPGSFNGIRVGLSVAKGLAYSLDIPIKGINNFAAIASRYAVAGVQVVVLIQTIPGQFGAAIFTWKNGRLAEILPPQLVAPRELAASINQPALVCGDVTGEVAGTLTAMTGDRVIALLSSRGPGNAGQLALIAQAEIKAERADDVHCLEPLYLRKPHITRPRPATDAKLSLKANRAVIWDMDGVIVNSAGYHLKAWNKVFADKNIEFEPDYFWQTFGSHSINVVRGLDTSLSAQEIDALIQTKEEMVRRMITEQGIEPLPGAIALIHSLKKRKVPMAVASSAPLENIKCILNRLNIRQYFRVIIGKEEVVQGKPHPEVFLKAALKLGIEPAGCLVIEDSVAGVTAAVKAGMAVLAVTGTVSRDALNAADRVVGTLEQIDAQELLQINIENRRKNMQKSLILVKPDGVQRGLTGAIIARLEELGLKLVAVKMLHADQALAERHYAVHRGKPFYNDLVSYITSSPIAAAVFEGDDAISRIRKACGATDPAKSEKGTIRGDYGLDIGRNTIHASDSPETAAAEVSIFFKPEELQQYSRLI